MSELISADTLKKLDGFIEMSAGDIRFLDKMLRENRVEKALEVGVSAGGSSAPDGLSTTCAAIVSAASRVSRRPADRAASPSP